MRAIIKGNVQSVLLLKPTKKGIVASAVYVLQNGPNHAPEITRIKYWGGTIPKVGDDVAVEAAVSVYKMPSGDAILDVSVFSDGGK